MDIHEKTLEHRRVTPKAKWQRGNCKCKAICRLCKFTSADIFSHNRLFLELSIFMSLLSTFYSNMIKRVPTISYLHFFLSKLDYALYLESHCLLSHPIQYYFFLVVYWPFPLMLVLCSTYNAIKMLRFLGVTNQIKTHLSLSL